VHWTSAPEIGPGSACNSKNGQFELTHDIILVAFRTELRNQSENARISAFTGSNGPKPFGRACSGSQFTIRLAWVDSDLPTRFLGNYLVDVDYCHWEVNKHSIRLGSMCLQSYGAEVSNLFLNRAIRDTARTIVFIL
jgi:hypothetical protein